jgi:hypothetical protein
MYYGSFLTSNSRTDAKCWVLGDKLLCTDFKNYALGRLYAHHTAVSFTGTMTCEEVQYVCDNTISDSKLRQFYVSFVMQHFSSPDRLHGAVGDWDKFLQNHPDIRTLLLHNFRHNPGAKTHIGGIKEYLEANRSESVPSLKLDRELARLTTPMAEIQLTPTESNGRKIPEETLSLEGTEFKSRKKKNLPKPKDYQKSDLLGSGTETV